MSTELQTAGRTAVARKNTKEWALAQVNKWNTVFEGLGDKIDIDEAEPWHRKLDTVENMATVATSISRFVHAVLSLKVYPYERTPGSKGTAQVRKYAEEVAGIHPRTLYVARAAASKHFEMNVGKFVEWLLEDMQPGDDLRSAKPKPWQRVVELVQTRTAKDVLPPDERADLLAKRIREGAESVEEMQQMVDMGEMTQEEFDGVVGTTAEILTAAFASARKGQHTDTDTGTASMDYAAWCKTQPCMVSRNAEIPCVFFHVPTMKSYKGKDPVKLLGCIHLAETLAKAAATHPDPVVGIEMQYGVNLLTAHAAALAQYVGEVVWGLEIKGEAKDVTT